MSGPAQPLVRAPCAPPPSEGLLMSDREWSCSAIGRGPVCPSPKQATVHEQLLVDTFKSSLTECRSSGGAFSLGPCRSPYLGQASEPGGPGNKLRTLSCRVLGPSPWSPTGKAQALLVTLTHPCLCDQMAAAVSIGCHHAIRGTWPCHLRCLGASWVLGT